MLRRPRCFPLVQAPAHLKNLIRDAQKVHAVHAAERRQGGMPLPDQVGQPARGGDDDVRPPLQGVDLRALRDPAVDGRHPQAHCLGQRLEHLLDLGRELTRRHEHEPARPACRGPAAGEPRGQREREA